MYRSQPALPPADQHDPTVSVVICSYTEQRLPDLRRAVTSVAAQLAPGDEMIVVIDHNEGLLARATAEFAAARVLGNQGQSGLSDARNTGIGAAGNDVVAFLDDDAVARPGWLTSLRAAFGDSAVAVAGTGVEPQWAGGRAPNWFPAEFGWVVGCSYRGLPTSVSAVRNPIGASMAVRRAVFAEIGGFSIAIGRVGTTPVGCEETEFCLRVAAQYTDQLVLFTPTAAVDHHVPAARQTVRYFVSRCYHEGRSKRIVTLLQGTQTTLSTERTYVRVTLPAAVARGVLESRRRPAGLLRAAMVVVGLSSTVLGYGVESLRRGAIQRSAIPAPAA